MSAYIPGSLTAERLREVVRYEPETGDFYWLVQRGRMKAGQKAGSTRKDGRRVLRIDNGLYLLYRVAVLYMTGSWPSGEVDHENTDHKNNAWRNLRPATRHQNSLNTKVRKDNRVGLKCVQWSKYHKKYVATFRGKFIGYFNTPELANAAYFEAAQKADPIFARAG